MERPRRATLKQNTKIFNIGAQEWLPDRLKAQTEDILHLLFHAVAWQYFPKAYKGNVMRLKKRLAPRRLLQNNLRILQWKLMGSLLLILAGLTFTSDGSNALLIDENCMN